MSGWKFDEEKTRQRYKALRKYYREQELNADSFACKYWPACSGSHTSEVVHLFSGFTAGLSPFYDVSYQGTPIRVLIVGKETKHDPSQRFGTWPHFGECPWGHDLYFYGGTRTSHIKGTLLTLQRIYGVTSDYVYASYALSNALRCGFQDTGNVKDKSSLTTTKIMWQNCPGYLVDEIKILEPTLIITQGAWAVDNVNLIAYLESSFGPVKCHMKNQSNRKYGLYEFSEFMCITSHHPARWGVWLSNYAPDTLWPMIERLKMMDYLPSISSEDSKDYEQLVKPRADSTQGRWQSD